MKCFSLTAKLPPGVAPGGCRGPCRGGQVASPWNSTYPRPRPGIELDPSDRCVVVGWTQRIPVSKELLEMRPESGAIERDGRRVTLLRASVELDESGAVRFVPERSDDREGAIVYLDIGAGRWLNLQYRNLDNHLRPDQILARVKIQDGLRTRDEKLLVKLKPFEPLLAVRSARKWWFWGSEQPRETLTIRFDGRTLFYDTEEHAV